MHQMGLQRIAEALGERTLTPRLNAVGALSPLAPLGIFTGYVFINGTAERVCLVAQPVHSSGIKALW